MSMSFSASCPRMLLHSYTEPQWLLPSSGATSSLDRLEAAEVAYFENLRRQVLPEDTPSPIGIASDEAKTFAVQQQTEEVDLTKEPALVANFWTKYQPAFHAATASMESKTADSSPNESKRPTRQSDASMDMSMSSSSFSMSSPTSRTG